jgi:replicative DNA helicase
MSENLIKMTELLSYAGKHKIVHWKDYLLETTAKGTGGRFFNSGFYWLDTKCGLRTGEVVVITGYQKNGKTLFAESWCRAMAKRNSQAKVVIFSYEVQPDAMLAKYVRDEDSLEFYLPMSLETMDFDWLKNRCLEAKLKHECSIVMIDHLHFMVDMSTKQNMSLNIGGFMRRLKQEIALGLNMAVLLIAHQQKSRDDQEASINTIRDSSFITQESDATIVVSRRKNLNKSDLQDFIAKYGEERVQRVMAPVLSEFDDEYSAGLAWVKIGCHRRTGVWDVKKTFKKNGDFLEEV